MKNLIKIILPFLVFASALFAQTDAAMIRKNVRELEYRLLYLHNLAEKYRAQRVLKGIRTARENLEKARDALLSYQQIPLPAKLLEAWREFKTAKKLADLAAKALLFKPLAGAKKDFDRLIQRAEVAVHRSENAEARYMLIRARTFQKKSVQAYRTFQLIRGHEYQRIATYFANKALEFSDAEKQNETKQSNYKELSENLNRLYSTILSSANNNPNITRLIENADSYLKLSKKYFEQGDVQQAILRLQIGERLLYRALDLQQSSKDGKKEQLRSNLFSLKNYLDGVERTLRDASNVSGTRILQKARQFSKAAHRDYEMGNYNDAQRKISLAQRMATKAFRYTSTDDEKDAGLIKDRIREVKRILSIQKEKYSGDNTLISELHKQAESLLKNAQNAADKGDMNLASWQIRLTYRIASRIDFLLNNKPEEQVDLKKVKDALDAHRKTLQTLESKNNLSAQIKTQISFLENMLHEAEKNIRIGNLRVALELSHLIDRQLSMVFKEALNR